MADGFKAKIVAIDREAVILYKRALNKIIAEDFTNEGISEDESLKKEDEISIPVYSPSQEHDIYEIFEAGNHGQI